MGLIEKAIAKDMEKRAAKAGQVAEIVDKIVAVLGDHPLVEYKECYGGSIRVAMYVCGNLLVTFERQGRELVFGGAGGFSQTISWGVPESQEKLAAAIAERICRDRGGVQ